jgi:hypothetical protein
LFVESYWGFTVETQIAAGRRDVTAMPAIDSDVGEDAAVAGSDNAFLLAAANTGLTWGNL